jgi:hypothetical protein
MGGCGVTREVIRGRAGSDQHPLLKMSLKVSALKITQPLLQVHVLYS